MRNVTSRLMLISCTLAACGNAPPESAPDFNSREGVLQEIVRIDGHQADLVRIGAAALRSDGVIAVNQAQDGRLLFFGDDGTLAGSVGRRGEGPGEFMNPVRFGWAGDTLWVYDGILRRFTWIGPDFREARVQAGVPSAARPPVGTTDIPEFPFAFAMAPMPDGSILSSLGFAVNQIVPEAFRDRSVIGRISAEGIVEGITIILPQPEAAGVTTPDGGSASLPFGNSPRTALAPDGSKLAIAMASLSGADAGTFVVTAASVAGDTLLSRRYPFDPEPIPSAVADSALEAAIERVQRLSASLADAIRRDGTVPPLYPPITNLLIGNDGTYWIELRRRGESSPYYVIDSDGTAIGTVRLPAQSRVAAADGDRLWVMETDDLDVQHLVRYALTWD